MTGGQGPRGRGGVAGVKGPTGDKGAMVNINYINLRIR